MGLVGLQQYRLLRIFSLFRFWNEVFPHFPVFQAGDVGAIAARV
jgi:hypothetical protein